MRPAVSIVPVAIVWTALLAGCSLGGSPERVARQYLERGAEQDLEAVAGLVEDGCTDEDVLQVRIVRIMGIPMTIDGLEIRTTSVTGDTAIVRYTLEGSVKGKDGKAELLGVKVDVGELSVDSMTREGEITLVREGFGWKVACP